MAEGTFVNPVLWLWPSEDWAAGLPPGYFRDHPRVRDALEGTCPTCGRPLRKASDFAPGLALPPPEWAACWLCSTFVRVTTPRKLQYVYCPSP